MAIVTLNDLDRGDVVTATAVCRAAGVLTNPTTITFIVKTSAGETSYVAPHASITNPSAGTYVLTVTIADDVSHLIRVVGTGAVVAAALGRVNVQRDGFTT